MLTTLMASLGTPMLLGGDEFGRTQAATTTPTARTTRTQLVRLEASTAPGRTRAAGRSRATSWWLKAKAWCCSPTGRWGAAMAEAAFSMPWGAQWLGAGRAAFHLWAPAATGVQVLLDGRRRVAMADSGDGRWLAEAECSPGTPYRFELKLPDGRTLSVADPASRAQQGDVDSDSLVLDPGEYRWQHPDWQGRPWHEAVVYELHVGALGGFDAVAAKLPALAALGITAVELMPVADFPGPRNWGYDGVLPFAPDSAYGTPSDLKRLIDSAHGLGLMVLLDVVYNHFGPDGNYLHDYAPGFFKDGESTAWGGAIDFAQPEVRSFFTSNARYWLEEYRFDGLRIDAAHAIAEQDWLTEMASAVRTHLPAGRRVHLVLEHDGNAAGLLRRGFDAQWNDDGHHALHVLLTGEKNGYYRDYAEAPAAQLARCLAEGFAYQGEASFHRGGAARGETSADLPPTAFVLFLQNHDQTGNRAHGDRLTTTGRTGRTQRRASHATAVAADTAAFHGRGMRLHRALSVLHQPPHARAGRGRAPGPARRVRGLCRGRRRQRRPPFPTPTTKPPSRAPSRRTSVSKAIPRRPRCASCWHCAAATSCRSCRTAVRWARMPWGRRP
jgi:malto-oligosyltrehalose trehalohydrolase